MEYVYGETFMRERKRVSPFFKRVISTIRAIPPGSVATYGQIAVMAGSPQGARQVAWILRSSSEKHELPWHRVINGSGGISLPRGDGYEEQMLRLVSEGVIFSVGDRVDLNRFLWRPEEN